MFKKKKDELNPDITENLHEDDIKSKLYESNTFLNKLDFNVEYLNKYIVKMINAYLNGRYNQDISLCDKYLSDNCTNALKNDISRDLQYSKYSNAKITINSIDIIKQNIQSVNYVSDIVMNIKIRVIYHKENLYTEVIREVIEEYTQKLWFIFGEKGWILEKYYSREFTYYNDDKVISM